MQEFSDSRWPPETRPHIAVTRVSAGRVAALVDRTVYDHRNSKRSETGDDVRIEAEDVPERGSCLGGVGAVAPRWQSRWRDRNRESRTL